MKKIEVLEAQCIRCGMCYSTYPEIFAPGSDSEAVVIKPEVNDSSENEIGICPTGAIVITEQ